MRHNMASIIHLSLLWTMMLLVTSAAADDGAFPLPPVPWDKIDESVKVTANGVAIPVHRWSPGNGGKGYAHFDCDGPVEVVLTFPKRADLLDSPDPSSRLVSNDWKNITPKPDATQKIWTLTMRPGHSLLLPRRGVFICASQRDPDEPRRGAPGVTSTEDLAIQPNGSIPVTAALQGAIDRVAQGTSGKYGRVLLITPGVYITGTLFMRDGVRMHLAPGAILRGAEQADQWRWRKGPIYQGTSAMIFVGNDIEKDGTVVGVKDASITGRGTIDGWGHWFRRDAIDGKPGNGPYYYEADVTNRARLIMAIRAEKCRIEGVTLRDPTFWTVSVVGSSFVDFSNVKVYSNHRINGDGINFDSSIDCSINACVFATGDDSHCLKNEGLCGILNPNQRISVRNSISCDFPQGNQVRLELHQGH